MRVAAVSRVVIAKALGGLVQQVRMNSAAGRDEASGDA